MTGPTPVPRWTRASVPLVAGKDSSANRAVVNAMTECQKTTGMTALELAQQQRRLKHEALIRLGIEEAA